MSLQDEAHTPSPSLFSFPPFESQDDSEDTEHTSLVSKIQRTPLPKLQLFAIYFIQFCEPVTAVVIYPFAPQLVRRTGITGGDERKTGYYTGIIESVFMISEVLTVYHWGQASNKFGRRPILLIAPLGLAMAMLGFGLSNSYWWLVIFRCLQGSFNGNVGVSKSVIAELTDATNIGDAIALTPLMWSTGEILGPAIGGLLSNPSEKWPKVFGEDGFFAQYPYFLPCAIAGLIAFFAFIFGFLILRETLPSIVARKERRRLSTHSNYGAIPAADETARPQTPLDEYEEKSPSLWELLQLRQVRYTLAANALYFFCDAAYVSLIPLVYSSSIGHGGLGLSPNQIGVILMSLGLWAALVNALVLNRAMKRFGARNCFVASLVAVTLAVCMFPVQAHMAKVRGRVDGVVGSLIGVQLILGQMLYVAYACIQVLVIEAAPSNAAVASCNSLAQMLSTTFRAVGPSLATSLFSISLQSQILGGQLVYVVLILANSAGVWLGFYLPKRLTRLESSR